MRRGAAIAVLIAVAAMSLSGCSSARKAMGWDKRSPDEFTVVSRAPLTIPPEFKLTPPRPGAPRPETGTARDQARRTLLSGARQTANRQIDASSNGQLALLKKVGADQVDPHIRDIVDQETSVFAVEDQTLTEKLMFWTGAPEKEFGTTVNPGEEARRLREAQALGETVDGTDVPTISRKPKGLLEDLIN